MGSGVPRGRSVAGSPSATGAGATAGSPRVALRPPLLLLLLLLLSLLGGAATAQPVSREESRELRDEASSLLSAK